MRARLRAPRRLRVLMIEPAREVPHIEKCKTVGQAIDTVYMEFGFPIRMVEDYHARHDNPSLLILTVCDRRTARREAKKLLRLIEGKTVIEIGAGVGLLSLEMAKTAAHVYAIELDPSWSWVFVEHLYFNKPQNLTFIFGDARELIGKLRADVAVIYTRSGIETMRDIAKQLAGFTVMGAA